MGLDYRDYMWDQDRSRWAMTNVVKTLILVHAIVWFLYLIVFWATPLRVHHESFLQLFGLVPEKAINRFYIWQFFTYPFLHSGSPFHILFNMLILFFFGRDLENLYGKKKFLILYFGAAFLAGLAYCVMQYISAFHVPVIGASGAVMGVMVLYALHFPYRKLLFFFILPMEVWVATLILIGLDLAYAITSMPGRVAHFAHLGGALFGFLFYRYHGRIIDLFERIDEHMQEREEQKEAEFEMTLDEILQKIHENGIGSLSRKEKDFLRKASEKYQDKK